MNLTQEQKEKVENTIKESLRKKLLSYNPETNNMPFHYRLLGRDRMALYSFIQSLNTTFGTAIFAPIAETLASLNFAIAQKQYIVGNTISEQSQIEIQHIINELTIGNSSNKIDEIIAVPPIMKYSEREKSETWFLCIYIIHWFHRTVISETRFH